MQKNGTRLVFQLLFFFSAAQGQTLLQQSFTGSITGQEILYNIFLPANYDTATVGLPVIYHLHGAGGNQGGNQNVTVPVALAEAFQSGAINEHYIVVFPNGLGSSMWADSKDGLRPAETHLVEELIPHIDANYKTLPGRADRYIQGFSMGGFGAAKFIAKYPELFQSAVAFDGAMHDWATLVDNHPDIAEEMFDNDPVYYEDYAPWKFFREKAADLADSVCFRMVVAGLTDYNYKLRDSLLQWNVDFDYLETSCPHNLGCVLNEVGISSAAFQEDCSPLVPTQVVSPFQNKCLIYPNPTRERLFLQYEAPLNSIRLLDLNGQLIRHWEQAPSELDLSELPPGMYYLQLSGNNYFQTLKVLKI
ncbi:MAG: T9SS type A sorting domain-containing protein [Phaeodactylibacter sp.]|nr:T9SS type A sorting domain-containing protein [Phaeodactylibacter sp.]